MTTDRESLLAAIVAHPGEDTPRLALGDWLDEHGSPADRGRAEFIRLQCALAGALKAPRHKNKMPFQFDRDAEALALDGRDDLLPVLARCRDLYQEHFAAWHEELLPGAPRALEEVVFHRGFPVVLPLTVSNFVGHGERLLRTNPVETVHLQEFFDPATLPAAPDRRDGSLSERMIAIRQWIDDRRAAEQNADRTPAAAAVAGCAHLASVRRLDVSLNDLGSAPLALLLGSEQLGKVVELDVSSNRVGPAGAASVAGCEKLRGLESLSFWFGGIGTQGALALAESPHLSSLRELQLYANGLSDAGLIALAGAQSFGRLEVLGVGYNQFGVRGLHALAHSPSLPRLTDLDLRANEFGDAGCEVLARSPLAPRLTELRIATNRLTAAGVRHLASAALAGLESLDLLGQDAHPNDIGAGGADALAVSPHTTKLRDLDLTQTELGDDGAAALATGPGLTGLNVLTLGRNRIGPAGARALVATGKFVGLRKLVLEENPLGPTGAATLAAARFARLRYLDVEKCELGDDGLLALIRADWFNGLVSLRLNQNGITDRAAVELARSPALARLTSFDLSGGVGDDTAAVLAASPHAANLRWLSIGENLTDDGCRALAASPHLDRVETLILTENEHTTPAGRRPLWDRFGSRLVFGGVSRERDLAGA
ncbi:TIGR02996 domain-containing protein [Gemmata sp. JC673]|uniref:TIGR02996 domain-containing protein n=1 Tax=Gemmata algarum TaxID=2975278 RepID=A0ABU5F1Q7_9BACT|nr:TIGR02996 domain-containing protein [Gemmata algarum]MDY3561516.1 TIGR02996 domain-containing protein [Gemmata algarum]